jgi:4-aminobutyrate aminotransferase-like enzyme
MTNAFDPERVGNLEPALAAMISRRQKVLGPSYKLFYEEPVRVARAEGVWLYDPDGRAYLDLYNNVPSVGHCHARVVSAIARQSATLNTHTRYLNDVVLDYAEALIARFPAALSNVMFTCTGSEASDLAMRIARAHTGGRGVIVTSNAYHGVTASVSEFSPSLGALVPLGAEVRVIPAPDPSRLSDVGQELAAAVTRAIADLQRHGVRPAALMVDTLFSSDGMFPHPAGFLTDAVAAVRAAGGLFIADEVQPGFGRTGTHMWGFERHGLSPDLVVLGKPMGNGVPIGGVVARPELLAEFSRRARYFNTFGGNPVSCAAGLEVLRVLEEEALLPNSEKVGGYLLDGLEPLCARFDFARNPRGAGLFLAVDFVRDDAAQSPDRARAEAFVNGLRRRGILIGTTGPNGNVLKIRPPLPFSSANADQFLAVAEQVLRAL